MWDNRNVVPLSLSNYSLQGKEKGGKGGQTATTMIWWQAKEVRRDQGILAPLALPLSTSKADLQGIMFSIIYPLSGVI